MEEFGPLKMKELHRRLSYIVANSQDNPDEEDCGHDDFPFCQCLQESISKEDSFSDLHLDEGETNKNESAIPNSSYNPQFYDRSQCSSTATIRDSGGTETEKNVLGNNNNYNEENRNSMINNNNNNVKNNIEDNINSENDIKNSRDIKTKNNINQYNTNILKKLSIDDEYLEGACGFDNSAHCSIPVETEVNNRSEYSEIKTEYYDTKYKSITTTSRRVCDLSSSINSFRESKLETFFEAEESTFEDMSDDDQAELGAAGASNQGFLIIPSVPGGRRASIVSCNSRRSSQQLEQQPIKIAIFGKDGVGKTGMYILYYTLSFDI